MKLQYQVLSKDISVVEARVDNAEEVLANHEERITALENAVDELVDDNGDIKLPENITALKDRMTTNEQKVQTLEGQMQDASDSLETLDDKVVKAKQDIQTLDDTIGDVSTLGEGATLASSIASTSAGVASATAGLSALTDIVSGVAGVGGLVAGLAAALASITSLGTRVSTVEDNSTTNITNITNVSADITQLRTDLDSLVNEVVNLDSTITIVGSNIDNINGQIATLSNKADVFEGQIATLNTFKNVTYVNFTNDVSDIADRVAVNETDITDLDTRVTALEAGGGGSGGGGSVDLTALTNRVSVLEPKVQDLETNVYTNLYDTINGYESRIVALETYKPTVENSLFNNSFQIAQIQGVCDDLQLQIDNSEANITTNTTNITNLQTQVDSLSTSSLTQSYVDDRVLGLYRIRRYGQGFVFGVQVFQTLGAPHTSGYTIGANFGSYLAWPNIQFLDSDTMRPGLRDNTGRSASRSSVVSIESAGDGAGNIKITLKNTIKTWLDNLEVFKALQRQAEWQAGSITAGTEFQYRLRGTMETAHTSTTANVTFRQLLGISYNGGALTIAQASATTANLMPPTLYKIGANSTTQVNNSFTTAWQILDQDMWLCPGFSHSTNAITMQDLASVKFEIEVRGTQAYV